MWAWLLSGYAVDLNPSMGLHGGQPSTIGFRILSDIERVCDADPNLYGCGNHFGRWRCDGDVQARSAKCLVMRRAASLRVPVVFSPYY